MRCHQLLLSIEHPPFVELSGLLSLTLVCANQTVLLASFCSQEVCSHSTSSAWPAHWRIWKPYVRMGTVSCGPSPPMALRNGCPNSRTCTSPIRNRTKDVRFTMADLSRTCDEWLPVHPVSCY